jgi:hypothetical protein
MRSPFEHEQHLVRVAVLFAVGLVTFLLLPWGGASAERKGA